MKVSIIVPVYNGEAFIEEAIKSVVEQTYTDWELIIINDSSTDTTEKIISEWCQKDTRISLIQNSNEKGLYGALNTGLSHAKGLYICRFDADDINEPTRLAEQVSFLDRNLDIAVVGGYYKTFGANKPTVRKHPTSPVVLAWKFISNTYFCHPSTMFRMSILKTVPEYPNVVCEDFAFFSKVMISYKGANIPKVLILYREHATNYSITKRELIKESVLNTYTENFLHYNGSVKNADIFYQFHANRNLRIHHIPLVISISFRIAKKILLKHNSFFSIFRLSWEIKKQVFISLLFYYLKPIYRFFKSK